MLLMLRLVLQGSNSPFPSSAKSALYFSNVSVTQGEHANVLFYWEEFFLPNFTI